jgi:hypothetical protein
MTYDAIEIKVRCKGELRKRYDRMQKFFGRCPGMEFYLKPLLRAYHSDDPQHIQAIIAKWESSAPRPKQRMEVLSSHDTPDELSNFILFGRISGTGKTTVAHERIWRDFATASGMVADADDVGVLALTGHAFARRIASGARDLDAILEPMMEAEILLIDDLDKRGDKEGKFSPIVQQTLFDLIEARSTREFVTTILTLNSDGAELEAKFDPDIGPYLLRRLRERFLSIDFDPVIPATNILPMEATA